MMSIQRRFPASRPVAVDLFSGAGGMSLGFEQAGFDIVLAVDRDGYHTATHTRNFPNGVALCRSVTEMDGESIRKLGRIEGDLDLVIGGPPCQGFSHMGLRDVGDPRNTLVDEFVRIVGELQPKAFVMENVPGMQSGKTAAIFERAITGLEDFGYRITHPVRALNAMDFGVPQRRERLVIVGLKKSFETSFAYPEGPLAGQPSRPTVAEAIADLPDVDQNDDLFKGDVAPFEREPWPEHHYARVARGLMEDPTDASRPRLWNAFACSGCSRVRHSEQVRMLYDATRPGDMVPGHKLPRLHPDGIAPTLRAGSESERGSYTAPRPIHPFLPRCITVREAARLHGFPDWFSFYPARWHAYRQIGNAVCPPVARAIGWQMIHVLGCRLSDAAPEKVVLGEHIQLPADRPRQHRRIIQMAEFPRVIEHLFGRAYDRKRRRLRRSRFTVTDIKKAILATSANMPRTRPERFLEDLARSRNVERIVALPLSRGYSIVATDTGGAFVSKDEPGTVHGKDGISVATADLISSQVLRSGDQRRLESSGGLASLIETEQVAADLWGRPPPSVLIERDLFGAPSGRVIGFSVTSEARETKRGCAIIVERGNIPTKSRIASVLLSRNVRTGIIVAPITRQHIFFAAFEMSARGIVELSRRVYRLPDSEAAEIAVLSKPTPTNDTP